MFSEKEKQEYFDWKAPNELYENIMQKQKKHSFLSKYWKQMAMVFGVCLIACWGVLHQKPKELQILINGEVFGYEMQIPAIAAASMTRDISTLIIDIKVSDDCMIEVSDGIMIKEESGYIWQVEPQAAYNGCDMILKNDQEEIRFTLTYQDETDTFILRRNQ